MESSAELSALEHLAASPPFSQLSIPVPWGLPLSKTTPTGILGNVFHKSYLFHYNVEDKKKKKKTYIFSHIKICVH